MKASDIELALSRYFHRRRNFIIPNVSWGFRGLSYEVDLMVVTSSNYAYEIEIKTSASDLKRDTKKHKWNYCLFRNNFRKYYFAFPEELLKYQEFVPGFAGILTISYDEKSSIYRAELYRDAAIQSNARIITEKEYSELGRLCMLRMWNLKENHSGEARSNL